LDMGFIPDIERICKLIPFTRQTLFFSATMPPEITRLADQFLHTPVRVEVSRAASTATTVEQKLLGVSKKDYEKRAALRDLIRNQANLKNGIIFCNRKRDVSDLFRSLDRHGFSVGALHGDMDQRSRMAMLAGFKDNKIQLLVASDVAARGLDIPDVSHVFNFDVPIHAEDYVHRIGRTGRAGREGAAFTLVSKPEIKHLEAIEKLITNKIEWLEPIPEASADDDASDSKRGRRRDKGEKRERGKRGGKDREARAEPSETPVAEVVAAEEAPRTSEKRDARPEQKRDRSKDRRRHNNDDGPVPVGFGEDIPAFIMNGQ
ncbi:MAG: DEAD/DEAH box helicase, partial [Oricola sp.]|nr:DEAD/DEAH box helicase [Oricola sp.]